MPYLTQAEADAATAAGVVFADGVARGAASFPRRKPLNNRIGHYGHSFVARGYTADATQISYTDYNLLQWGLALSGQRLIGDATYASGVVGDTIEQALTRLPTVVAWDVGTVFIELGTNDSHSDGITLATMQTGMTTIINALLAVGKTVVIMPILPTFNYYTVAGLQKTEQFNRWLYTVVAQMQSVYVVDALSYWTDLTSSIKQAPPGADGTVNALNYTVDNYHASARGAFAAGLAIRDFFNWLMPPIGKLWNPYPRFDAITNPSGNLLINPMLATTGAGSLGTGFTGAIPDGWGVSRSIGTNITGVLSLVAKPLPNGQTVNMQQMVLNNPGSGVEAVSLAAYQVAASGKYIAGSATLRGLCDVEVDAGSALCGVVGRLVETGSTTFTAQTHSQGDFSATATILPPVAWTARTRTPALASKSGNTAVTYAVRVSVPPGGSATVRIGNAYAGQEA